MQKNPLCNSNCAKECVGQCERNSCEDTQASEEQRGEGSPAARAEIPKQTIASQAALLQPTEVHGGAEVHLQFVENPMLG